MAHSTSGLDELKGLLSAGLEKERRENYGRVSPEWITYAESYHGGWDASQQSGRLEDIQRWGFSPGVSRILDVAGGCGQFLQYASLQGYDVWAVEPEQWKLEFINTKFEQVGLSNLNERVVEGIGEELPFEDSSFDCVTTYQTLEHVQDPLQVLREMIRVTKPGGGIYLRCPDYRGTFEPHYQLPWLPLFPRSIAKLYLRLLGRPVAGLASIGYITKPRILKMLSKLESQGPQLLVYDEDRIFFENILRRRGILPFPLAYELWCAKQWVRNLFRQEGSVNLFIRVVRK